MGIHEGCAHCPLKKWVQRARSQQVVLAIRRKPSRAIFAQSGPGAGFCGMRYRSAGGAGGRFALDVCNAKFAEKTNSVFVASF